jgi:PncC family amidohydrolase
MEPIVNQIHKSLIRNKKTVAVAESCTGGLVSKLLTDLPGSSGYFVLGLITYSNASKASLLKINPLLIRTKGAVSKEVALKMAQSARKLAKVDFGIGITGIAGPGGQTAGKPAGTVFIAISAKRESICKKFRFHGSRTQVRKKAALESLALLRPLIA